MITFLLIIQGLVMIASAIFAVIIHKKDKAILNAYKDKQTAFMDDNDLPESEMHIQYCEYPFVELN